VRDGREREGLEGRERDGEDGKMEEKRTKKKSRWLL
jgi:hypothetical protein